MPRVQQPRFGVRLLVVLSLTAAALSACGGSSAASFGGSASASALDGSASSASGALSTLIEAENAAVYAYGVIGAHLTGSDRVMALAALKDHRRIRDGWITAATAEGELIPPAAIAYDLPFPVRDRDTALALAKEVETRLADVYRSAGPGADEALAKAQKRLAGLTPAG